MTNKFDFLKSTRFWAIVIGSVAVYLQAKGIFGEAEMILTASITSLFTLVRTIDRNTGDAKVGAAKASVN
jgi:hypothetical protein